MSISRGALLAVMALLCAASAAAQDGVVKVGKGGYLTGRPGPCKPLPDRPYKTGNLKKPMLTGQWWSSLVFTRHSQPLFAHPLCMVCTDSGLAVGYPGEILHGSKGGINGNGMPRNGDFMIGHSSAGKFPEASCDDYSDWFVTAAFGSERSGFKAGFGHGSPFVYCLFAGGNPTLTFSSNPTVWAGGASDPVLGVTVGGHHYGLFGPAGSTWTGIGSGTLTHNLGGKPYFSVALLPDNKPATLAAFKKLAYNHVVDTQVNFTIEGGFVKSSYDFTLKIHQGTDKGTLFALYPHQWKYVTSKLGDATYGCPRGVMKVGQGASFTTAVPIQGTLPMFPAEGVQDRQRMIDCLQKEARETHGGFKDTYGEGKHLGKIATLSGIAEVAGAGAIQKTCIDELKRRLESWFTAAPGKNEAVFYYNSAWETLIGSKPSFGTDNPINDHHFHYGYFIRAAAEVARVDPAWAREWGPMVVMLIRDIASPDREDKLFPYARCFDKYAGHSWASGDANFADGNNQESSSESLNAWYGMTMWGLATGDARLRDMGLYLFNTERTAVEEYWFDVSGANFPKDFPNVALGMVWGAKGAFGTWFSGDIDCIHGINWLPFTPASIYMGRNPAYVKKNHDRIIEGRKGGRDYNSGWGDLVIMFHALSDPAPAAAYIDAVPDCKIEGGNSHSFMYHWIYTLKNLGINDTGVTADHPMHNVLKKGGAKTYAVYNYHASPLTVTFSDGKKVTAKPKAMTVVK